MIDARRTARMDQADVERREAVVWDVEVIRATGECYDDVMRESEGEDEFTVSHKRGSHGTCVDVAHDGDETGGR